MQASVPPKLHLREEKGEHCCQEQTLSPNGRKEDASPRRLLSEEEGQGEEEEKGLQGVGEEEIYVWFFFRASIRPPPSIFLIPHLADEMTDQRVAINLKSLIILSILSFFFFFFEMNVFVQF